MWLDDPIQSNHLKKTRNNACLTIPSICCAIFSFWKTKQTGLQLDHIFFKKKSWESAKLCYLIYINIYILIKQWWYILISTSEEENKQVVNHKQAQQILYMTVTSWNSCVWQNFFVHSHRLDVHAYIYNKNVGHSNLIITLYSYILIYYATCGLPMIN